MKKYYEELFNNSSSKYDSEFLLKDIKGDVDFIVNEIQNDKSLKIIDICCGTGRYTYELAKRGFKVTSIVLSDSHLKSNLNNSYNQNLKIDFQKYDVTLLPYNGDLIRQ